MFRKVKNRAALTIGVAIASAAVGLIVPTISGAAATPNVITIAEPANATPNYILPFYPPANCTVTNWKPSEVFKRQQNRDHQHEGLEVRRRPDG